MKPFSQSEVPRNASMDILRTIAILFVICHHLTLGIYGLKGLDDASIELTSFKTIFGELLNCFFVIGVDLFFLLSGYFGIKLKKGKILSLFLKIYFYYFCVGGIRMLVGDLQVNSTKEAFIYFLSARNGFWYINTYVAICLVSPALNFIAERLNGRHVSYFIFITLFLFCFWGFLGSVGNSWGINGGYSPLWGGVVYLYGRVLKAHKNELKSSKLFWGLFYLAFTLTNFIGTVLATLVLKKPAFAWKLFNYNNPLLLASSVSLLMFFANVNVKKKKLGMVFSTFAVHSLGVYVLHTTVAFGFLTEITSVLYIRSLLLLPNALIIFFCCVLIDMLYDLTLKRPFDKVCIFIESLIVKGYCWLVKTVRKLFVKRKDT